MKKIILIVIILFSQKSYSQKVEDVKFDKFDSVYTITTKDENLVGKLSASKFLYVHTSFTSFKKQKFINLPNSSYFKILIGFKTDVSTATDNKTEIKIEFVDNTFGSYTSPNAKYQVITDMGFFTFEVLPEDKLFTTDIKTIRISTSDTNLDYDIPFKKASYIKNALIFTKSESENK